MNNNVLFIIPPYLLNNIKQYRQRSFKAFPYGVLSIVSYCAKNQSNYKLAIHDCNNSYEETYMDELKQYLQSYNPEIIGISLMFDNSYQYMKDIVSVLKEFNKDILIVVGGQVTITTYKEILNDLDIDVVCYREGEKPFLELLQSENKKDYIDNNNTWITKQKLLNDTFMPQQNVIENLDECIDIDYSFIDIRNYHMEEAFSPYIREREIKNQFFMVGTRNCPYSCTFCMQSENPDKKIRYASVDNIINHVEYLIKTYRMNILTFYDDQILFNRDRAKELFRRLIPYNLRIECPNGVSVAYIDDELAMLMRKAGMDTVYLAIESGSEYVLNKLIRKPLTLNKIKPVVDILKKYDFWIQSFIVIGMPGETKKHRKESLEFLRTLELDWVSFSIASPVRGSKLYKDCIDKEYLKKNLQIGCFDMTESVIETEDFTSDEIKREQYLSNLDLNFVNNTRLKKRDYETAYICLSNIVNKYPNHAFAYYYLNKCLENISKEDFYIDIILNHDHIRNILIEEPIWKEYFEYFNIGDYQ